MNTDSETPVNDTNVRYALNRILTDDKFEAAPQMSAFLKYVVEETLDGNADRIKAYTVAVDALGKPATFDPQNDPSVRVLAKRLRSSLDAFYARTGGHELVIVIKCGSYKPHFLTAEQFYLESDDAVASRVRQPVTASPASGLPSPTTAEASAVDASPAMAMASSDPTAVVGNTPAPAQGVNRQTTASPGESLEALATHRVASSSGKRQPTAAMASSSSEPQTGGDINTATVAPTLPRSTKEWLAMGKRPKVAVVTLLLATAAFGLSLDRDPVPDVTAQALMSSPEESAADRLASEQEIHIQLAGETRQQPFGTRPEIPTLRVVQPYGERSIDGHLAGAMIDVLSRFDSIDVVRETEASLDGKMFWPEEYLLSVNSIQLGQRLELTIQLVQANTGRVAHVETRSLNAPDSESGLTALDLLSVKEVAALLVQAEGPLMEDYASKHDITAIMSCQLGKQQLPTDCSRLLSASGQEQNLLLLQAQSTLEQATQESEPLRSELLTQAVAMSREAVQQSPYSATAQIMLSRSLHATTQLDEAMVAAQRAEALNPFDGEVLRLLAILLQASDQHDASNEIARRADRLTARDRVSL